MHQITVIEPKWLSEVAPTFFRVADQNRISKRKANEKIEPLYDRFAADKDDWVSCQRERGLAAWLTILTTTASQQTEAHYTIVADIRARLLPLVIGPQSDPSCYRRSSRGYRLCCTLWHDVPSFAMRSYMAISAWLSFSPRLPVLGVCSHVAASRR